MKKSIKNLDAKSIKNAKAIKGGIWGKRRDAQEEKDIPYTNLNYRWRIKKI